MTVMTTVTPVSPSMVLAIIDEARAKDYRSGVIGIRGAPDAAVKADVTHHGQAVRVRPAESALAVREVLTEHRESDWLVVVTDRDDDDLGAGILAHFIWQRLRSPDPWDAVRRRFAATGIDPALTTGPGSRDLAVALLAATPPAGWPAAPAGVLTRTHALSAVAAAHLGLDGDTADVLGILHWSMSADSVTAVGAMRRDLGEQLADATLDWIARRTGAAAAPVQALLHRGELADVAPLGVLLALLTSERLPGADARHQAQLALARLEQRWGGVVPNVAALRALGEGVTTLLSELVHDRRAQEDVDRVLARADALAEQVQTQLLSRYSDLLPSGFRARLALLADALRSVCDTPSDVEEVETGWAAVQEHQLGVVGSARLRPFEAAVRLVRWLATRPDDEPAAAPSARLDRLVRRHVDHSAWADAAINGAFAGDGDADLASALQAVVTAAQGRRHGEERAFAEALAQVTAVPAAAGSSTEVMHLERVLPDVVLPLARKRPVLLLVMDGMSVAAATEILEDATTQRGWAEAALPGSTWKRRAAALAVLPSVTEVSRASLLCGRLTSGQQSAEQAGYADLTQQGGKIRSALFHKKAVDTTAAGWAVSHEVGAALDDTDVKLVTIVLNTIDDALDRSDPAGTVWTAEAVKHLEPLLARARSAGRTVVMTSDHGHVVERRQGTQRSYSEITSGRSRAVTGTVEEGEIEVSGPRVLAPGHRAVLAVDEGLRYGPLRAGYHGGASAAEVVVPVTVLVPNDAAEADLALLPPQIPAWWLTTQAVPAAAPSVPVPPKRSGRPRAHVIVDDEHTLFDVEPTPPAELVPVVTLSLGRALIAGAVYKAQQKVAGRLIVTDEQVATLVDALAAASASRLPRALAAQALGVSESRLAGALAQVRQLLNVEGYAVLASDAATGAVLLDLPLLREQFEVRS